MNLKPQIRQDIIALAQKNHIQKVILFGSRARGDNGARSDIDLAVTGGNVRDFRLDIDDEVRTLLLFDVVDLDGSVQKELLDVINQEGITLYEEGGAF